MRVVRQNFLGVNSPLFGNDGGEHHRAGHREPQVKKLQFIGSRTDTDFTPRAIVASEAERRPEPLRLVPEGLLAAALTPRGNLRQRRRAPVASCRSRSSRTSWCCPLLGGRATLNTALF